MKAKRTILILAAMVVLVLPQVHATCPEGFTLKGVDTNGNEVCEKPSTAQKIHEGVVQAGIAAHETYQTYSDVKDAYEILTDPTIDAGTRMDAGFSIAESVSGLVSAFSGPTETQVIVQQPKEPESLPAFDLGSMTGSNPYGSTRVEDSPYLGQNFEPQHDGVYVYVPPPPPAPPQVEPEPEEEPEETVQPPPQTESPKPPRPQPSSIAAAAPPTPEPEMSSSEAIRKIIQKCGAKDIICQKKELAALKK